MFVACNEKKINYSVYGPFLHVQMVKKVFDFP